MRWRWIRLVVVLVAVAGLAPEARAGLLIASSEPHYPGLRTGALQFAGAGTLVAGLGFEYLPDVTNAVAGVRGELARVPTVTIRLGLAEFAEFRVTWPAYNRLRVIDQANPPPLGRRLGDVSTDWGDVTVATLIQLRAAQGGWPGSGIKFAAKLPNTNEKLGIGDNTTDLFASVLMGGRYGQRFALYTDLGLGILSERTETFTQNDVFTYGALADWRTSESTRLVAEVNGQVATHRGGPGTESRSELRAGVEVGHGGLHWSALALRGLSDWDSRGVGVSLNVSAAFTALKRPTP
jgi:hypothetical protein